MNVPKIEMDPKEAAERAEDYDAVDPAKRTAEDEIVLRGYWELAAGRTVIDVAAAMQAGGVNQQGLPALAIGRADWPAAKLEWHRSEGSGVFMVDGQGSWKAERIRFPRGTWTFPDSLRQYGCRALTPMIPPQYRPAPSMLRRYYVLWEAVWVPIPPVDPFLLQHLGGYLYVVVAQWNLTALEQAVLRSRIEQPR